jgi:hypothetical protein
MEVAFVVAFVLGVVAIALVLVIASGPHTAERWARGRVPGSV